MAGYAMMTLGRVTAWSKLRLPRIGFFELVELYSGILK